MVENEEHAAATCRDGRLAKSREGESQRYCDRFQIERKDEDVVAAVVDLFEVVIETETRNYGQKNVLLFARTDREYGNRCPSES